MFDGAMSEDLKSAKRSTVMRTWSQAERLVARASFNLVGVIRQRNFTDSAVVPVCRDDLEVGGMATRTA